MIGESVGLGKLWGRRHQQEIPAAGQAVYGCLFRAAPGDELVWRERLADLSRRTQRKPVAVMQHGPFTIRISLQSGGVSGFHDMVGYKRMGGEQIGRSETISAICNG
jgi:hypothetical protein